MISAYEAGLMAGEDFIKYNDTLEYDELQYFWEKDEYDGNYKQYWDGFKEGVFTALFKDKRNMVK